jgi:transcriptional regulator with XRE-family HTH domain
METAPPSASGDLETAPRSARGDMQTAPRSARGDMQTAPRSARGDMQSAARTARVTREAPAGRRRAADVAARLGVALRDARRSAGLRQADVAERAGLSQPRVSELERGKGTRSSLQTWGEVAAAVGEQLVGFLERAPGASLPRDIEHLRRQAALIDRAKPGGWTALPELAVDMASTRSRSIDVALVRSTRREAVVAEIWDWFDDVGAGLRSLDGKREAIRARLERDGGSGSQPWRVRCLYVVRQTRRNQQLLADLRALFAARFPASSTAWLRALGDPDAAMPHGHGLLWSRSSGALDSSRLGPGV